MVFNAGIIVYLCVIYSIFIINNNSQKIECFDISDQCSNITTRFLKQMFVDYFYSAVNFFFYLHALCTQ